jgi:hypothetical protein
LRKKENLGWVELAYAKRRDLSYKKRGRGARIDGRLASGWSEVCENRAFGAYKVVFLGW